MARQAARRKKTSLHPEAAAISRQVLLGLAGMRARGFHFPGYFLNIDWPVIGDDHIAGTMPVGPQSTNADGTLNPAAFGVLLDTAVAITSRLKAPAGWHQATVQLHAQFTGRPIGDTLSVTARHEGHTTGSGVQQAVLRAAVSSGGETVCYATSAFIHLPLPGGVASRPPPRQRVRVGDLEPLRIEDLDAGERKVLRACDLALKRADSRRAFIEHFWSVLPRPVRGGARCDVTLGAQFGNRAGVVQGGLLFGLAAATAQAAAPRHKQLSSLSAWFIGGGRGARLTMRSSVVHAGRSIAVVRTEIKRADGARVLETLSHHAA